MEIYGYHRTSTTEQKLDRGIKAIEDFCMSNGWELKRIYTDQITGRTFDRPRYTVLKEDILRKGDVLIISELDRLGRDKNSTLEELRYFRNAGIRVMILEIPTTLIDFSEMNDNLAKMMMDTINNLLLELYATLAHAEMEKRTKRQREGMEAKKSRGEWSDYGRPAVIEMKKFETAYKRVEAGEIRPVDLMKELKLKKSTYYKYRFNLLKLKEPGYQ